MSLGLAAFRALADAARTCDALRAGCAPGTPAWVALTECVLALEGLLAALVEGDPLEEEESDDERAPVPGDGTASAAA